MKQYTLATLSLFSLFTCFPTYAIPTDKNIEEIVIIRHGEKPANEIGQIDCRGLNRAMLLPGYFAAHFPAPKAIFAPNPTVSIHNDQNGKSYDYLRPLATIEPTAISLDLPINTEIGFNNPKKLAEAVLQKKYHDAVIYIAWEHVNINAFARLLLSSFNSSETVPDWPNTEYDRVYIFNIDWNKTPATLTFKIDTEGLGSMSSQCPQ